MTQGMRENIMSRIAICTSAREWRLGDQRLSSSSL
jgi:hypothetical protein